MRPRTAQKRTVERKVRPRTAQKRAGKEKCVRTLPENTPWEATGALPHAENAPRRQNAPAHCPKTHRGKQWERSHEPKTRRGDKMSPRIARKHAVGSNGSTPTCQKRSMEGKMCLWFCLKRGWRTGRAWGVYGLAGKLVCALGIVLKFVGLEGVRGALELWKGVPCRVRGVI